jgi:hypothetical protein
VAALADARLGEIPLGPDGYGEAFVPVGPWALRVTVERAPGAPGSADLFGEDPADLLGRVLRWAVAPGHETVDLFLDHHLAEFAPDELSAIAGEGALGGVEGLRAALQPIAAHFALAPDGGRQLAVDLGFGADVTEVVLVVEVDGEGLPVSVDAES